MKAMQESGEGLARRLWLLRNRSAFVDAGPARRPRLLVDVSMIVRNDAGTGIQRVVRAVWSHLKARPNEEFDVVPVYAERRRGYCFAPVNFLGNHERLGRSPVGVKEGDCFLGLDLAAHYLPKWVEQVDAWRANGATVHVVVYDLLPVSHPGWFPPATSAHFAAWLNTLMISADQLLCISEEVAGQMRRLMTGIRVGRRPQIGRLHLSGDVAGSVPSFGFSPAVERTLELARKNATVVMVGTVEPRKAYDRAISAFELLWASSKSAPSLVIIGKPGWKTAALQDRIERHRETGRRLHWLSDVSDEALSRFYAVARALLIASYAEGFGLPLAEAAMHQRWALVRDLQVFREQRLPNALYFSDDSATALAMQIETIAKLAEQQRPPPATLPSWPWCVERLIEEIGFAEPMWPAGKLKMTAAS